jgi:hypothetical protein
MDGAAMVGAWFFAWSNRLKDAVEIIYPLFFAGLDYDRDRLGL